ncbi:MAG: GrpB family protein [Myxococcota bacterium]|nr:GrpB family protein [Myxococcota bacterium]
MKVELVPHDPAWAREFAAEANRIREALNGVAAALHHVGSTAIPAIHAKSVIDICLEVSSLQLLDQRESEMVFLGYVGLGEYGIPERRFFRKDDSMGVRTHHVHAFETGSWGLRRHIAFRDYMIAHPDAAESYSRLKEELVLCHAGDREAYIEGKDPFIREHEARALRWSDLQGRA